MHIFYMQTFFVKYNGALCKILGGCPAARHTCHAAGHRAIRYNGARVFL